jgi:hypothetical protein
LHEKGSLFVSLVVIIPILHQVTFRAYSIVKVLLSFIEPCHNWQLAIYNCPF